MGIKYGRPMPGNTISLSETTMETIASDSVYIADIWVEESTWVGWEDLDATGKAVILVPFNGLHTRIQNDEVTSPKTLLVHFGRTVSAHQVGIGAFTGDFSNLKVTLLGSGGVSRTLLDESGNSTKYSSRNYEFAPELFNALKLEFYTTDTVTVSNITIQKSINVTSQIKAATPDGTLVDIGASESGNLKITDAESGLAISKGVVIGSTFIHKFGAAPDFDTADGVVTVWDGADDSHLNQMRYVYSTGADIDTISSESIADTQELKLQGLDLSGALVEQTVTLQGQTKVTLDTPLYRIFRMKNNGTVDNVGHIYCYEDTATTLGKPTDTTKVRAVIQPGNNQTLMAVYTIPAGKTGYMRDWYAATAGASKSTNYIIQLRAREPGKVFQLKHVSALADSGSSHIQHDYSEPEKFAAGVDIEMRVEMTAGGASGAAFAAGFDIVLVDDV